MRFVLTIFFGKPLFNSVNEWPFLTFETSQLNDLNFEYKLFNGNPSFKVVKA